MLAAACTRIPQSPREPFGTLPASTLVGSAAGAPFLVLDAWRWAAALDVSPLLEGPTGALEHGALGLLPAGGFRLATGECEACTTPPAALWWFRDELIAVAEEAQGAEPPGGRPAPPPVLWLGAPQVIADATLSGDARALTVGPETVRFAIAPPLPTNTAYVDASTARFFRARSLRVRGATTVDAHGPVFVARTIWPKDARIMADELALEPLAENEFLGTLIEAQKQGLPGAFPPRLLFEREPGAARRWGGKPVLAFVLSGAQGDDDGARGGHLAVATGRLGAAGEWSDLLVNNFYPLLEANAKGIIPAQLPIDNYLFDLNSGQLYYRPGYMLVAVLAQARTAAAIQEALQRTMLRLYCRDIEFDRARFNSTAMTMDPIRDLGWRIPGTGPTSRLAAIAAAPFAVLVERRLAAGRNVFAMFSAERTRLLPRAAFEVAGHDLLLLASGAAQGALTSFERMLVEDVEAILFVQLPQVPSSRRFGTHPVGSLLEYGAALLADPGPYESAPDAGTRELPAHLARSCAVGAEPPS